MAETRELACSLRAMHAACFPAAGHPDALQLTAVTERMGHLLAAADKLDRLAEVQERLAAETTSRQQAQIEREAAQEARNRCRLEADRKWREVIREVAQAELARWQAAGHNSETATTAILALCAKLGVTL